MNIVDLFALFCIFCFVTRWMYMLMIVSVGGTLFMYCCQTLAIIRGWQILNKEEEEEKEEGDELGGVSIIKPLKGITVNLEENLETFFTQDYHKYEILFCLETVNDRALPIVRKLVSKYPDTKVKILIGKDYGGLNEKVNNMMKGYNTSRYNMILFSDSSHKVRHDSLNGLVRQMTSEVGQVLQIPYIITGSNLQAIYEKVYFGTMYFRFCLISEVLGIPFGIGSSTLVRKDVLDMTGGLGVLSNYLAEDHYMTTNIRHTGYKVVLSNQPSLIQPCCSITVMNERIVRWSKLHAVIFRALIFIEPFGECFLLGLTMSWAVGSMFECVMVYIFICHCLMWFGLDYLLLKVYEGGQLNITPCEFLCAWMLRELSSLYLTTKSHMRSSVAWHGKNYRLKSNGEIQCAFED